MGLSQLLCVDWVLVWNVVSSEVGLWQFDMPLEWASWYVLKGTICFLSEATSGCMASVLEIIRFTMMGYPPFLLSDTISTSQLLPLFTPQLLTPESKHVFPLALTSPARPSTTVVHEKYDWPFFLPLNESSEL